MKKSIFLSALSQLSIIILALSISSCANPHKRTIEFRTENKKTDSLKTQNNFNTFKNKMAFYIDPYNVILDIFITRRHHNSWEIINQTSTNLSISIQNPYSSHKALIFLAPNDSITLSSSLLNDLDEFYEGYCLVKLGFQNDELRWKSSRRKMVPVGKWEITEEYLKKSMALEYEKLSRNN